MNRPTVGVTIGDPAGIGPEIVAKAAVREDVLAAARPLIIGSTAALAKTIRELRLDIELVPGGDPGLGRLAIHEVHAPGLEQLRFGQVQAVAGRAAALYVEAAVQLAREGRIAAIATAPLNKEALWAAGYPHSGHTEMLEALTGSPYSLTVFIVRGLKIFFLTRHLSLREAITQITTERTLEVLERAHIELRHFGLSNPRIALAGLNPHAGEGGALGMEEKAYLEPAILEAQRRDWNVTGPVPADAVFHQALEGRYDAVLALYHDQGHIAAKTVDFHGTVSVTLGLPFLRTSVDHGTAFDIAGEGIAREGSMAAAIIAAADLLRQRDTARGIAHPAPPLPW